MAAAPASIVQVRPAGGRWETLGRDRLIGIVPEGITCDWDEHGPRTFQCQLRGRRSDAPAHDLQAFTELRYFQGSTARPAWSGFILETPNKSGAHEWTLNARGWQFHWDDQLLDRCYVHTRMRDWRDARSLLTTNLSVYWTKGRAEVGDGAIVLSYPQDTVFPASATEIGVVLDLGPDNRARRVVMTWESSNNDAGLACYCRGCDIPNEVNAAAAQKEDAFQFAMNSGVAGVSAGTFTVPRRYVFVFLFRSGAATYGAEVFLRIKTIRVFTDTAYESGGASILTADQVIKDVRARALPRLLADESGIQAGSFAIPEYATSGYETPRQIFNAVNAYQNYRLAVDIDRRLIFEPRPTSAVVETVADLEDAAANSGEAVFNEAIVNAISEDGSPVVVRRTTADLGVFSPAPASHPTNPSFDTNTTGWTTTLGTLTRDTSVFDSSPASGRLTASAGGVAQTKTTLPNQTPGRVYAVVVKLRTTIDWQRAGSLITVLNAAETQNLSTDYLGSVPIADGAFSAVVITYRAVDTQQVLLVNLWGNPSQIVGYIDTIDVLENRTTLPDQHGFTRSANLPLRTAPTDASAAVLADVFLSEHTATPSRGSCIIRRGDATMIKGGAPVDPVDLGLLLPGGLLRFRKLRDPQTGASHRNERVVAVSYDANEDTATVSLSSERQNFEALAARMAVIAEQVPR